MILMLFTASGVVCIYLSPTHVPQQSVKKPYVETRRQPPIDMKKSTQKALMKTSVAAAAAMIALVVGGAVGYLAAPLKPGETVTVTTSAPAVTKTVTATQTVTSTPSPPAAFSIQVTPAKINDSIPGQRCVFLVTVAGDGGTVTISATAPGSTVTVEPQKIAPGQVAEVTAIPGEASVGENLTVTVQGARDGLRQSETAIVVVGEDLGKEHGEEMRARATEVRDAFIPWLAANHPELGITSETEWTPTIVRPHIMVVMFYLFFSEDWEMGVSWHVMISPHDWARIYLRHRSTEVQPSYAFEILSLDAQEEPNAIDPKDAFAESVWR